MSHWYPSYSEHIGNKSFVWKKKQEGPASIKFDSAKHLSKSLSLRMSSPTEALKVSLNKELELLRVQGIFCKRCETTMNRGTLIHILWNCNMNRSPKKGTKIHLPLKTGD